ncbi:hypothetical protein V8C34DRAFT_323579 [Trichoderma compactum]
MGFYDGILPTGSMGRRQNLSLNSNKHNVLEEDKDTNELVTSYVETLTTVLGTSPSIVSGADIPANLKDPTMRQTFMKRLVEEGQANILTSSKVTQGVGNVAEFILSAKRLVDAAIQNIPQAALPWAGVCVGLQILLNPAKATKSNITGIVHVVARMDWYSALTEHLLKEDPVGESLERILPQLETEIVTLYKAFLLYQMKSVCSYYRHQRLVFLRNLVNKDDWDNELKIVEQAEATFQRDSKQYTIVQGNDALAKLIELSQKELQLDDTDRKCRWDLRVYTRFVQFDGPFNHSSCQLLWIKGHAGTGKTMLLMGIIRSLEKRQDFCAPGISCFLCQGTDVALNNATAALRSLVWMLVVEQPHLISHLRQKSERFFALSKVLLGMLDDPELSPILFVVVALDECDRAKPGLNELLGLISTSIRRSDKVKWLLSSRPEIDLTLLRGKRGPPTSYEHLLWVSLAFQHIETVIGEYTIQYLKAMPPGLLKLYDHMMTRIENVEETNPEDCKKVLVCAVLAFRPITLPELAALSGMSHNMTMAAIELCGSFLATREDTVYLIHQSAKDYLSNNFNRIHSSGIAQGHVDIGRRSIGAMVKVLKQNMYDLDNGFKPENMEPPQPDPLASIRYSCVVWADHFVAGTGENPEGKRASADDGNKSSELARFLKDVETFIQTHASIIARAPLQAYASALIFSPTTSEVRETQWEHRLPFIQRMRGVRTHWGTHRQILEGHSGPVRSVTASPDDKLIASASDDKSIRLWDLVMGSHVKTFEGHSDGVMSVSFSPDGKTLASASNDKTIRLWDITTGSHIQTLKGHKKMVYSASFSPDGQTIVSALEDHSIPFWDTAAGSHLQTLEPYWVRSVALSSNGKYLTTDYGSLPLAPISVLFGQHCSSNRSSDHVLATTVAVCGNKMASGHESGRVTVLEVNFP